VGTVDACVCAEPKADACVEGSSSSGEVLRLTFSPTVVAARRDDGDALNEMLPVVAGSKVTALDPDCIPPKEEEEEGALGVAAGAPLKTNPAPKLGTSVAVSPNAFFAPNKEPVATTGDGAGGDC